MNLVDEIHLTVALSEFIFCVNEDKTSLGGNLLTACKQFAGVILHLLIVLLANDALGDDFLL